MENPKIAIFVTSICADVPDGCPDDYVLIDYEKRKAFAEWLKENGKQYVLKETSETTIYQYNKHHFEYCVAVVSVDLSRPWLLHIYDGKERIWYLDQIDEYNQVRPDVQPVKGCAGFCLDSCVEGKV